MKMIKTTAELAAFCEICSGFDYVTIDTEFLRERTYYSKLCLIQMAHPGDDDSSAVLIDVLADTLNLDPLYELFQNESVVKVFHAARQDLEIFYVDRQILPKPFFDTQVAAMVCGYGEQVGYETLVRKIAKQGLDKSSRFTDWSARPLSAKQMTYAIGDVTHLREIYETLAAELKKSKRQSWVEEELAVLLDPQTYISEPKQAYMRVKTRTNSWKILAAVRELAEFREDFAQKRNIPRNRVMKDDAIMELAATRPQNIGELNKSRLLLRDARKGDIADGILAAIKRASAYEASDIPKPADDRIKPQGAEGLAELLRVMLKAKAEGYGVAQKLIANAAELDAIAAGERDGKMFKGWRAEVFGDDALRLCEGKVALASNGKSVKIVNI
ncbi:ribonuclease D [Amylibacter ulvae]|uniref:Ribonuclease D n=1 Tax=Paramylibacter ulvae TaxID=1651968 RepID=A0ABQ3CT87_9RHOB|nr:ribonuclease D [Amylibacter ulvae]GHA40507.1 ribonuclease D [Amylibacter ulvae]